METTQIYIFISLVVLAIIALVFFLLPRNKGSKRLTPLAGLAFGFIIAGSMFSESWYLGYGLIGTGVILAIADIIIKLREDKRKK
jgi:lipopolysaccharide export LptBFGC system permease protein LptF